MLKKKINILSLLFTRSNIICTLSDLSGKTLRWVSAGSLKTRGTKKITMSIITLMIKFLYDYNKSLKYKSTYVKIKGINKHKVVFIKYLKTVGFNIIFLQEDLIFPYNGCKRKLKS